MEPIGLALNTLDATAVSDFDGKFEAKGVGPAKEVKAAAPGSSAQMKPPKAPKRPKAPKKPKLEKFEAEMPKYSDKCVGYGDLWKKVQESTVDPAGEVHGNAAELETEEESLAGFKSMHPCDVAAARTGIRSKYAGGDGKPIGLQMGYNELEGCFDRAGSTSFKVGQMLATADMVINKLGVVFTTAGVGCSLFFTRSLFRPWALEAASTWGMPAAPPRKFRIQLSNFPRKWVFTMLCAR